MNRCQDTLGSDRCEKPQGHDGMHRKGDHIWGFRDIPKAAWVRLAEAHAMRAKELVG